MIAKNDNEVHIHGNIVELKTSDRVMMLRFKKLSLAKDLNHVIYYFKQCKFVTSIS